MLLISYSLFHVQINQVNDLQILNLTIIYFFVAHINI